MAGEKKRRQRKLVTATNLTCCRRPRRGERCEGPPQRRTAPGTARIDAPGTEGLASTSNWVVVWAQHSPLSLGGCPHAQEGTPLTKAGDCTQCTLSPGDIPV